MKIEDVLGGLGGITEVQQVLSGEGHRAVLRDALRSMLPSGYPLGSCRLRRAKFRTARRLAASYDVRVGDDLRPIAVIWAPAVDVVGPELSRMEAEAVDRGVAAPFRRLVTTMPERKMRVQVAPLDAEFPQLARAFDPEHVRGLLGWTPTVTPVRYRPGSRHLVRYDGEVAGTVFAKLYRTPERSARAYGVATGLGEQLASSGMRAARPLAWNADDALVLYPRVAGVPLTTHLARSRADLGPHLHTVGTSLRALHRATGVTAELAPHSFASEARKIANASEHIHTLLPRAGTRIASLLARANDLYDELPHEPSAVVHGDLKADHLWVTQDGLTLIDFDTCYRTDPAHDLGKFLADLRWWHDWHDRPGLAEAQALFTGAYANGARDERIMRARVYETVIFVKITAHRVRLFARDWAARTLRLVEQAEATLGELEVDLRQRQLIAIPT